MTHDSMMKLMTLLSVVTLAASNGCDHTPTAPTSPSVVRVEVREPDGRAETVDLQVTARAAQAFEAVAYHDGHTFSLYAWGDAGGGLWVGSEAGDAWLNANAASGNATIELVAAGDQWRSDVDAPELLAEITRRAPIATGLLTVMRAAAVYAEQHDADDGDVAYCGAPCVGVLVTVAGIIAKSCYGPSGWFVPDASCTQPEDGDGCPLVCQNQMCNFCGPTLCPKPC